MLGCSQGRQVVLAVGRDPQVEEAVAADVCRLGGWVDVPGEAVVALRVKQGQGLPGVRKSCSE